MGVSDLVWSLSIMGITCWMNLSPLRNYSTARATGELGPLNPYPAPYSSFNAAMWILYSFAVDSWLMVVWSVPALVCNIYYTLIACSLTACEKYQRFTKLELIVLILVVILVCTQSFVSFTAFGLEWEREVLMAVTFISTTIQNYTPLIVIKKVIKKRDSSSIQRGLAFASLACTSMWIAEGIRIEDYLMALCMGPSVVFCFLQVVACCCYPRTEERRLRGKDLGGLTGVVPVGGGGELEHEDKKEDKQIDKDAELADTEVDETGSQTLEDTQNDSLFDGTELGFRGRGFKCFGGEETYLGDYGFFSVGENI